MSQVGRISGPLLQSNLKRNGIDLKISNTTSSSPILKFDVTNNRIGIGTDNPIAELQVPSSLNVQNLIATGTVNVADFTLANREINVNSGNIEINSGSLIEASAVATDAIKIEENNIYGTTSNEPIELIPTGDFYTEQDVIVANNRSPGDYFGASVDISGDYAIIGAWGDDEISGDRSGAAYIFKRTGSNWTQQQKLTASDFGVNERWGSNVAIDGDTAIVGSLGSSGNRAVYVFTRTGSTWTQQQKITAGADDQTNSRFGRAVDIKGDTLVVGASWYFTPGPGQFRHGKVYVFTRTGSTWTEQQQLEHPTKAEDDLFGSRVRISGNSLAVGVPGRDGGYGPSSGSVVVFTGSGNNWTFQQELTADTPIQNESMGGSLDFDGDTIIAGHIAFDTEGVAYVFTRTGSTWTQQQRLTGDTQPPGTSYPYNYDFGRAVGIQGDTAFVSQRNFPGGEHSQGKVTVFQRNNGVWSLSQTLLSSDSANKRQFYYGYPRGTVAIDNGYVIIGEYGNNGGNFGEGAAYIYNNTGRKTDIQSDLDVDENLHATGNITFGGTITLGSGTEDDVTFAADVASDIVPDVDNFYIFGRDTGLDSTTQRLGDTTVDQITATTAIGDAVNINGVNYALAVGNSFYVAEHGDDTNRGDHPQGAFRTIKQALSAVDSSAGGPTTIHIAAGTYTEEFPLTVPSQTNILGAGFREVEIKPTVATQDKDCFLLTGQTTVSNVTIMDYYYNSSNDTGYGFRFANNAITSTRSPYVQNVSVITKGSVTSASDPRGFNEGDAGRGALVDGSVLDANSTQASMLFHSVTFITPGAIGLRMKDGVRVEWLNSFTYFADIGIKAENGSTGFVSPHDGSTRNYGAEIRSIGSANVYGNQGAVADGSDCLMYLIQHNMAYIGTGGNKENDQTLRIEANETVELNSGKIYFQTTDAQGKFKVGDNFFADFETGTTSIDANTVAFDALSEIRIETGNDTTFIDGTKIDTGNIVLSGNKISSSTGNLVLDAITKHDIRSDVSMSGKLDITGNLSIGQTLTRIGDESADTVSFNVDLDQDLKPGDGGLRSLGSTNKRWQNVFVSEANIDDVRFFDNVITTTASNADLEFVANGTGNILFSDNNVQVDNDLEAGKLVVPNLTYSGNVTQTGDIFTNGKTVTGTVTVDNINVARDAFLKQIDIVGGNITNTVTNSDLILNAIGTGKVRVPGNKVKIDNDISVNTYQVGGNIFFTGDVDSNVYSTDNIRIFQNNVETTQSNSDLELRGSGTGSVLVENLFFKDRTITSGPPGVTNGKINFAPASGILVLSGTGALQFPKGNIAQRRNETGDVRFNSQLGVFEGFSTGTVTFGGIFSDDQQTSVQVHPTNNHLDFNVNGSLVGTINTAQVEMPGLQTDDILIDGKKITTNVSNSDLELTPNGNGSVNIIGNTINLSNLSSGIIENDTTGALTISATDEGYHKIGGTFGVRIPIGTTAQRGSGNQIGDTRYNTTESYMETWDGSVWQVSAGGGGETISEETMENLILEFTLALG